MIELLDSVYVMKQTFDGMTVCGTLVVGKESALLFDTLVFPDLTKEFLPLCNDRELMVIYSHADWDHVWGTCSLSPKKIIAQEECAKRFLDPADVEGTLIDYQTKYSAELSQIELRPPQETFKSNLTLDLGELTVELHHCPGHTKDSVIAIIPERNLLLGADCIETPLPLLNEGCENLLHWISELEKLRQDERISLCVPSHGEIGGRELIQENITYLTSLLSNDSSTPQNLDSFYKQGHFDNRAKTTSLRSI